MNIRLAAAGDVVPCAEILREWIEETPWFPRLHTREEDHAFIGAMAEAGQVYVIGEGVQGFLALDGDFIKCLYMRCGARRAGHGAALLGHAKAQARVLRLWTFEANMGAQAFYLREGFREVGRTAGDNEEGLPDIAYRWEATS